MPWDEELTAIIAAGIARLLEEIRNPPPEDEDEGEFDSPSLPESDDALGVGPDVIFEAYDSGSGDLLVRGTNLTTGTFGQRHFIPLEAEGYKRTAVRNATLCAAGWLVANQWTAVCGESGHTLYEFAGVAKAARKRLRLVPAESPTRVNLAEIPRGEDFGDVTQATTVAESLERRVMEEAFPVYNMLRRLREATRRDMGRVAGGHGPEAVKRLTELDAFSASMQVYSPRLVPGLLQTQRYAHDLIAAHSALPPEEVALRAAMRWERSRAFLARWRDGGRRLGATFVIGERAFRYPVAAPHVHVEQLEWLLKISNEFDNIVIQILPEITPAPVDAAFSIHELTGSAGHVAREETVTGEWYVTSPDELTLLYSAFRKMSNVSYDKIVSRSHIGEVLRYWTSGMEQSSSNPATATQTAALPSPVRKVGPSQ